MNPYREAFETLEQKYDALKILFDNVCDMVEADIMVCSEEGCGATFINTPNKQGGDESIVYCRHCEDVHACGEHLSKHLLSKNEDDEEIFLCRNCIAEDE
jgi:hypothetical protein